MQNLYLNIVKAINAHADRFRELGVEPFRTIDLYNGQPDAPEQFEFMTPALFVDCSVDWERGGSSYKQGVVQVDVHVLTDQRPGTEDWSDRKEDGIKKMIYCTLVGELLEEVGSINTGRLNLIGETPKQTDYFDYHLLTFDTSITRQKGAPMRSVADIKLQINA